MPWPGISLEFAILLLISPLGPPLALCEENVGCLFSNRLCLDDEWCYDDYAFGRCTPATGDVDEDDLYRFDLKREELHELKRELQRLFALGYRWSHGYTQCRLQAMLYAIKHDLMFESDSCSHLVDQDLEGALNAMDVQDPMEPHEMAIIKYTPSVEEPNPRYADEIYFPPVDQNRREGFRNKLLQPNAVDIMDMEDPLAYTINKREWIPQMHRRASPKIPREYTLSNSDPEQMLEFLPLSQNQENDAYRLRDEVDINDNTYNYPEYITDRERENVYPILRYINELELTPADLRSLLSPENYRRLQNLLERFENSMVLQEQNIQDIINKASYGEQKPSERFTQTYNTPDNFRAGWEAKDSLRLYEDLPEQRIYSEENDEEPLMEHGSGHHPNNENNFRELNAINIEAQKDKSKTSFRELQNENKDGFRTFEEIQRKYGKNNVYEPHPGVYTEGGVIYPLQNKNFAGFKRKGFIHDDTMLIPAMMKKGPRGPHPNPQKPDAFDSADVNTNDVFVSFNKEFTTWGQGTEIIRKLARALHLEPSSFENGHVRQNIVSFKVLANSQGLNASEVIDRINDLQERNEITFENDLRIIRAGDKYSKVLIAPNENGFIVIFMVCGVLAAMIVASVLLIIIRRHLKAKEKLQGLSRPDAEASKDYQDLCRARMSKGQTQGEHGRITSLSKESEQSPSSRSSTSSWSEEPALHNMDISTGHMVLSYMEDHLKNKDRLEQEWVALCAYVAEPSATTIAHKKENVDKNLVQEIVPYDHSRVVLNELCNYSSSDYINASSITDHDPRNPAYIATQGPLPNTSADFWQLIWEQGAVVIVMLTRLTESGMAMCHRYWPEEGSELYHIYEVHLVSEHIWCDDYLVRSFYLKNVRTGETRTVTQFHFLSWPETGVPASTKALLEFRRKVNKSYRGRSCPIVVHCSDGAGRTGTYCLIDMVLSRMLKGAKEIDIAATLEHLRDQRPKMVASKQQFEFVLTAVAEEVHAILKALPSQTPVQTTEKEK